MRTFKVIVIGDSNVGKTCLTFRFCNGNFPRTAATIGVDFREKKLNIGGEDIVLQLWDTAGQERFRRSMVQHYYRNVHAVVLVYDVTRTSSFQSLRNWLVECNRQGLTDAVPRLMIGNKCDQMDRVTVSTSTAQRFADLHNMPVCFTTASSSSYDLHNMHVCFTTASSSSYDLHNMPVCFTTASSSSYDLHNMPLFETSAKTDSECDHIESIFMTLAHKLKASKPLMSPHLNSVSVGAVGALEEVHRAETTAALQESGLVDVRSGDWSSDPAYTERQESFCC
ncbi:Small GTP-binding protein domain [Trinorchestia longiramus]|nr:Small GTP-binding protein domain [Trinorchestia longiramus]